jgi:uncharacterized protein (DUF3820 family)
MNISFGCYKGRDLNEVPTSYLQWALNTVALSQPMQAEICRILRERGTHNFSDAMPFGRYAGFRFEEVPLNYLSWMLANCELHHEHRQRIERILQAARYPEGGHRQGQFGMYRVKNWTSPTEPAPGTADGAEVIFEPVPVQSTPPQLWPEAAAPLPRGDT